MEAILIPLKNPRWEAFCQALFKQHTSGEKRDLTAAMLVAYPNRAKWNNNSQNKAASLLWANETIQARWNGMMLALQAECQVEAKDIIALCVKVGIKGELITDFQEANAGRATKKRTISRTWALERLCKMLGFDKPTETIIKSDKPAMSREDMIREIERLQGTLKK